MSAKIEIDAESLRPIVKQVAAELLAQLGQAAGASVVDGDGRVGYTEAEAAAAIGIPHATLSLMRRRRKIRAKRVGKRWIYSKEALADFLRQ